MNSEITNPVEGADHSTLRLEHWVTSLEVWLMFRPKAAYDWLASLPDVSNWRSPLRRLVFIAFIIGCMVSLVTSQRLTMRLVAGGAFSGSLLLLAEVGVLAVVCGRSSRYSFCRLVDLFFAGFGPWIVWMLALSTAWAFLSTMHAFTFAGMGSIIPAAGMAMVWSCYINLRFFERVLGRSRKQALWDTFRLWAACCAICVAIFGYGALWSEHAKIFHR